MEEMLEETLNMEEDEELEEEADAEVDKVLFDITDGKLGAAGTVKTDLPVSFMYNFRVISTYTPLRIYKTRWTRKRKGIWNSIRDN